MSTLEQIIAHGNRGHSQGRVDNNIRCADGFTLSVIAGGGTYCIPRPSFCFGNEHYGADGILGEVACDFPGPYTAVEVGFPSTRPEPWDQWSEWFDGGDDPTQSVYGYVPVEAVRELIALHGGEVA